MRINKKARHEGPYWVMPSGIGYCVANRYNKALIAGIPRDLAIDIVREANKTGKLPDILGN